MHLLNITVKRPDPSKFVLRLVLSNRFSLNSQRNFGFCLALDSWLIIGVRGAFPDCGLKFGSRFIFSSFTIFFGLSHLYGLFWHFGFVLVFRFIF